MVNGKTEKHQHGTKGLFFGGKWIDMEDMGDHYVNHHDKGDEQQCSTCPRSRSKNNAAKEDGTYDVIVIGAGCIGGAVARELSKTTASVLLLEAADDVTQGATKGNSGIVHAGFDDTPGSVRAKFCWPGNQMFAALDDDLHFGYQKNGSLVIAFNAEEMEHLKELKKRGEINAVQNLRIIQKEELFELEPYVNPTALGALLSPDAGNVIPYEYAIALIENAVDNNVELRIRREVTAIQKDPATQLFTVSADHWEPKEYVDKVSGAGNNPHGKAMFNADGTPATQCPVSLNNVSKAVSSTSQTSLFGVNLFTVGVVIAGVGAAMKYKLIVLQEGSLLKQLVVGVLLVVFILFGISIITAKKEPKAEKSFKDSAISAVGGVENNIPVVSKGGEKLPVEDMLTGGSGSRKTMNGVLVEKEQFRAKFVINCAGGYSDKIANMIGDHSFKIKPRLGDYLLLHKDQGHLATHTLFPCPGKLGKGVLVQTTLWGNLILGPTARDTYLDDQMGMSNEDIQTFILSKCQQLVPAFDSKQVIHAFCGARAKSTRGDWIIEASAQDAQFIHVAGIDSPGLAGSPAIAIEVMSLLRKAGLSLTPDPTFNPKRVSLITPKNGWKNLKAGPIGKFTDPKTNVVCKCEKVTEAEIVDAIHRSLPVDSTQAIRKRTRAGMGDCQANPTNYDCETRVRAIIARELGVPLSSVGGRPWPATSTLPQRWLNDADKDKFVELSKDAQGLH